MQRQSARRVGAQQLGSVSAPTKRDGRSFRRSGAGALVPSHRREPRAKPRIAATSGPNLPASSARGACSFRERKPSLPSARVARSASRDKPGARRSAKRDTLRVREPVSGSSSSQSTSTRDPSPGPRAAPAQGSTAPSMVSKAIERALRFADRRARKPSGAAPPRLARARARARARSSKFWGPAPRAPSSRAGALALLRRLGRSLSILPKCLGGC